MKNRSKYFVRNFASIFLGGVGSQAMYVLMVNYATIFFTDFLGISAGVAGIIFLISRIWDGINDPMCGIWIEKSNPKHGKVQTFMVVGGLITAVALVMLFTVPNTSLAGRTAWGAVTYNLVGMAFTAVTVATLLQMARGTDVPNERVTLTMGYTVSCSIAGIIMSSVIIKAMDHFGSTAPAKGYQVAAILSAIIGMVALAISAGLFKDVESEIPEVVNEKENTTVWEMVKGVVRVPSFLALIFSVCTASIGYGMFAANMMYYLTYVVKNPDLMAVVLPAMYIGLFAGSIIAPAFAKFGKKKMLIAGMFLIVIAVLPIPFFEGNAVVLFISNALISAADSVQLTYLEPALVDCAEYTEYKTGIRCQALALTGYTFASKMTMGLSSAILGFALQIAHYDGTADVQTEGAVNMIRGLMFWPALIAAAIGICIIIFFYKLDEGTMDKARAAIKARCLAGESTEEAAAE